MGGHPDEADRVTYVGEGIEGIEGIDGVPNRSTRGAAGIKGSEGRSVVAEYLNISRTERPCLAKNMAHGEKDGHQFGLRP